MRAIFPGTIETLKGRLEDDRSKRVLFLSHCLLNENARYMGGAFCRGICPEVLDLMTRVDAGAVQMPCPERISWGGVYKKHLYQFHGLGRIRGVHRMFALFFPIFLFLMNWRMRRIARRTAQEIEDYVSNGMEVVGIVGIRGSPTCAFSRRPDLRQYFEWSSHVDVSQVTREEQNGVLRSVSTEGPGFYMKRLLRELKRRKLEVRCFEFDLNDEAEGRTNRSLAAARGCLEQETTCASPR